MTEGFVAREVSAIRECLAEFERGPKGEGTWALDDTAPLPSRLDLDAAAITDSEYHADTARLSPSRARLLLPPSCPAKFKEALDNPPPPKSVFDFGQLVHRYVLGAGDDVVLIDALDYKSKAAQTARDKARADGLIPALPKEVAAAEAMAAVVHEHSIAGALLADGQAEIPLYTDDPETGVQLRGRPDWITAIGDRLCIVEYKTCESAEPQRWARKAFDYGYPLQAAWYCTLGSLLDMGENPQHLFVCQEKEAPFLVSVIELDQAALMLGARQMRRAIDTYVECLEADEWPGYADHIETVSLPPWAFNDY